MWCQLQRRFWQLSIQFLAMIVEEEVDEEVINGLDMEENGEDGVDFVMEDSVIDSEVKVVVGRLDVWRSGEGARVMTEEEKSVLEKLKQVFGNGLCETIPQSEG